MGLLVACLRSLMFFFDLLKDYLSSLVKHLSPLVFFGLIDGMSEFIDWIVGFIDGLLSSLMGCLH